jgi:DNA polymerase III epsilon subunit family exonuclease
VNRANRYWLVGQAVIGLVCLAWLTIAGVLLWAVLDPADWQSVRDGLGNKAGLLLALWALALVPTGMALRKLIERHINAPARLAEQARLLLQAGQTGAPRVESGDTSLTELATLIGRLADQREALRAQMQAQVDAAVARTEMERNRLAALMSELTKSVVVCNLQGQILLYNRRAERRFRSLSRLAGTNRGRELIGLGRSIYSVIDRDLLDPALESLKRRLGRGADHPSERFLAPVGADRRWRVHVTPVHDGHDPEHEHGDISGFVLLLENATPSDNTLPDDESPQRPSVTSTDAGAADPSESRPEFYDFDLFQSRERSHRLDDCRLSDLAFTVFDTETTGLDPGGGDEVLQIGAVRIVNGRLLMRESFDQLIDPQRPIPRSSISIHGITPDRIEGQPTIDEILPAFHAFCADTVLVAHNAAFDMKCLEVLKARTGLAFDQPVLDTLLLSALVHSNQERHNLDDIAMRFGLTIQDRHSALGDAWVTAEIFVRLIPLLAEQGIHSLGQALAASQTTYLARLRY